MSKKSSEIKESSNSLSCLAKRLAVALFKAVAHFPFSLIYTLSDFLFFLNKYIFKYRYRVTTENLTAAFPEKSQTEIFSIRDGFYHHFFDLLLESAKLYRMSEKELSERISFKGLKNIEKITTEKRGAIVMAFHYNNWEWGSFSQHKFKHPIFMVYNPPRQNKPMERFLTKTRGRWGGCVVETKKVARKIIKYRQHGKTALVWLAADQTALANSPLWTLFLNREASFFKGPVFLAQKTNYPIFFQHTKKVGRGKYEANFSLLVEEPQQLEAKEILRLYVQKMEEQIKKEPEYYLWSHKRWKHKRPKSIPLI